MVAARVAGFVTVSALLAAAGCVLFVPSADSLGTDCHLADETSACGKCIVASCQDKLNACCAADACRPSLSQVDACSNDGQCSLALAAGGDASGLATCIATSCKGSCQVTNSAPHKSSCNSGYSSGTPECSCSTGGTPNAVDCTAKSFPNAVCCADSLYPGQDTYCSCRTVRCGPSSSGCECSLYSSGADSTCSGSVCCASNDTDTCSCDTASDCNSYETQVTSCGVNQVGCGSSQKLVANCSFD